MLKKAALALALFATHAHASDEADQQLLLAPTTVPAQSEAQAPEATGPVNRKLSFGVGSGFNSFGGNMGKLVSRSSPVVEARGEWAFSPLMSARGGVEFAQYSYNASPVGSVEMNTNALQAAMQVHYLSTALTGKGFDPYASVSASQVFRTQKFVAHNSVEKDNAFAAAAGVGTNYLFDGKNFGMWIEADAGQIFFKDRYQSQFLESGLEDTTGLLYSARLGLKYYF